jgi:hypothetical protein
MYRLSDVLAHFKRVCPFLETVVQHASCQKEDIIDCPYKVCTNDVMFKDHEVIRKHLIRSGLMDNYIIWMSYPVFIPKPSTHRMHDPGSIVPHIRPKVFIENQMSRIKYNYYINEVSKDHDNSQRSETVEDSITPHEQQPG